MNNDTMLCHNDHGLSVLYFRNITFILPFYANSTGASTPLKRWSKCSMKNLRGRGRILANLGGKLISSKFSTYHIKCHSNVFES